MATITALHYRSDQQTVNGLTAYKLSEERGNNPAYIENYGMAHSTIGGHSRIYASSTLYILHRDGSTTYLSSSAGQVSLYNGGVNSTVNALLSHTYDMDTDRSLIKTDAIKVIIMLTMDNQGGSNTATFVSQQLGWNKIKSGTWTSHYYLSSYRYISSPGPGGANVGLRGYFRWGDSTYESRITV